MVCQEIVVKAHCYWNRQGESYQKPPVHDHASTALKLKGDGGHSAVGIKPHQQYIAHLLAKYTCCYEAICAARNTLPT